MPITITFSTAGNFTIEDDGTPGNATSIVRRDSDGVILAVIPHPADSLVFRAVVPGVNLTLNMTDSLGNAALLVGSLTTTAETPDNIVVKAFRSTGSVTLAGDGAITEGGSDGSADIVANAIILSAGTGIGTGANALETQTAQIEAETNTGGINIANFGALNVGGFSANVDGLDVVTSGDILLTNLGTITLADETSFDSVHGGDTSGNVTLIANGHDSDITSNVDQSSIIAARGNITLTAGRDVSFGLAGTEFGNDVRANGSIIVNAGRDFLLSGFADFFADGVLGTTGGNLIVNAGRNISLLDDTGNSASLAVLGSAGGDVILNAGPNGLVTLEPPSTNTISSGSGNVVVNADRLIIGATSGITAPGIVTLRPVTQGREISLGSLSDGATALELSDGELDRVFANSLVLGGHTAGPITVGAPIAPASITHFALQSGADILVNFSLTGPNSLTLNAGANVHQLAASTLIAASLNVLVGQVGEDGGTNIFLGSIAATIVNVTGNEESDTLNGTGADDTLNGGAGVDTMSGGGGNDTYVVDNFGDIIVEAGASGNDTAQSTAASYTLGANVERLLLLGTADIDGTGNALENRIVGNGGHNELRGGSAVDHISGGDGDDLVDGQSGHDLLEGGAGNDTLLGGSHGIDRLDGGTGADSMTGGVDNDTYVVDNPGDVVIEVSGQGNDTVESGITFTLPAHVERLELTGGSHIDGFGNGGANKLTGNSGKNTLKGNAGNDQLLGGGNGDELFGGAGNDTLSGGDGSDRFFFDSTPGGGNADLISDFFAPQDEIRLDRSFFAGFAGNGVLSASAFVQGAAPLDGNDRIMYDSATGNIFHDADGTGAAPTLLFATVTAGTPLTNADFFLVS